MNKRTLGWVALMAALSLSPLAHARPDTTAPPADLKQLRQEVQMLKQRLQVVEQQLQQATATSKQASVDSKEAREEAERARTATAAIAAPENPDIKFRLSGTVVANYTATDSKMMHDTFTGGSFMPIFLVRYKNLMELEAHMEVSNNGNETETSLEYAQLDLFLNDWSTLVAGKFLSPIGQFQQAQHPPWINKLPDRPAGFVEGGGGEPLSTVGVQLTGAFPVGHATADYAVFVGNGPQMTDEGLTLEGFSQDNNANKSVGARIGLRPWVGVNMGLSAMHAQVPTNVDGWTGAGTSAAYDLVDADFAWTPDNGEIRGEYIHSRLDPVFFDDGTGAAPFLTQRSRWNMWYLQGAYRLGALLGGDNPYLRNVELIVRRSHRQVDGGTEDWRFDNENRWTLGVDYWFGPTLVGKLAYERKTFQVRPDDNVIRAQLALGF
ncbi:hypothetical protein [Oleiagrimonas sp. C23AA]|uniref:hypothetical protein n=1 Tax=Oleiagrimonas sp. C23AA TaxID=2719047 RepID=UPI00141FD318|nr:hypothetical protein [Oleiagrimonas sp. C23AA]NII11197.1 hypothetical protein [Oleiagrimonas sp. C23AA]